MTELAVRHAGSTIEPPTAPPAALREVDVSLVAFHPDTVLLRELLASLAEPTRAPLRRNLLVFDNSAAEARLGVDGIARDAFARVDVAHSGANLGFGRGHNANVARGTAPFVLLVNQDCILEPGALEALLEQAERDAPDVAAWEMRQIPYEHPKIYDPLTLETVWVSGAAVLLRRAAFERVGGFEPQLFMYGEDVDLSWRLRADGWRLRYLPKCAVVHHTYREAHEVKPLQVFGGVMASLCLRARYGGFARTLQGFVLLAGEIASRQGFAGRRRGLVATGFEFLKRWRYFAATRVPATARFKPHFVGWSYEPRREGAFHPFVSRRDRPARAHPTVSILIRTLGRPALLREALWSCAQQTYGPLEIVVIEDGPARSQSVIDEFRDRLAIRYRATGTPVGRACAGNLAMREATGEWLNFLDDDDVFFADHVEVMVEAVQRSGLPGAYALAWEFLDRPDAHRDETLPATRHYQRFDRFVLWHHNYMPIQAVLFHRRLFERHGGFEEDMHQLEDWNLWTRFTLEDDFEFVEKTTSKYRVPARTVVAAERQALLDRAYADAIERQRAMRMTLSPRAVAEMVDRHARRETVMMVSRSDLRRFIGARPWLARVVAHRHTVHRVVRRLGWMR
jgi:GT2 family glycosyltransferase